MKDIARSEDIECKIFEVRKMTFINFGSRKITDQEKNLQQRSHSETLLLGFTMDT